MNISNREVPQSVADTIVFTNSNKTLFSAWTTNSVDSTRQYVVWSYGYHFPVVVYCRDIDRWFINGDKASKTTSKHTSLCTRDLPAYSLRGLSLGHMQTLVMHGYKHLCAYRLGNKPSELLHLGKMNIVDNHNLSPHLTLTLSELTHYDAEVFT